MISSSVYLCRFFKITMFGRLFSSDLMEKDRQQCRSDVDLLVDSDLKGLDFMALFTILNLLSILESKRLLIEQALSLREPMRIIVNYGLALDITLSVFSYPAIEAAAFLIAQNRKMAMTTGTARIL